MHKYTVFGERNLKFLNWLIFPLEYIKFGISIKSMELVN